MVQTRQREVTTSAASWLLPAGFLLYVGLVAAGFYLETAEGGPSLNTAVELFVLIWWYLVGWLILRRRPTHLIGLILCATTLVFGVGYLCEAYVGSAVAEGTSDLPRNEPLAWVSIVLWLIGLALAGFFLPLLFPDGRLPSPRWRPVAWLGAALVPAAVLTHMVTPGVLPGILNPISLGDADELVRGLNLALSAVYLGVALLGVVSVFSRMRRADREEQQQIKWFSYAAALVFLAFVIGELDQTSEAMRLVGRFATLVAAIAVPTAVGIAVLRYRLYDIDILINRTLLYGILTAVLAGLYTASIALFQRAFVATTGQTSDVAIVMAIFVLATSFTPIRLRLQSALDHYFKPAVAEAPHAADLDDIEKLAQLHSRGVLTDEEFAAKKRRVLGI